jgi:hypothetical protein
VELFETGCPELNWKAARLWPKGPLTSHQTYNRLCIYYSKIRASGLDMDADLNCSALRTSTKEPLAKEKRVFWPDVAANMYEKQQALGGEEMQVEEQQAGGGEQPMDEDAMTS